MMVMKPLLLATLMLGLAGCGSAEWPPKSGQSRSSAAVGQTSTAPGLASGGRAQVIRGDTVYAISRRYQVPVQALIRANGLSPPFIIQPGQWLVLPTAARHAVRRGDTLVGIARRYEVNPNDIARINGLEPPFLIRIGQSLRLPSGARAGEAPGLRVPGAGQTVVVSRAPQGSNDRSVSSSPVPSSKAPEIKRQSTSRQAAAPREPGTKQSAVSSPARKRFLWPVRGKVISAFGAKKKGLFNDGINIAASRGSAVRAAGPGTVAYVGNELRGFGNLVLIRHGGGWISAYAHVEGLAVQRGQQVKAGTKIARVGTSGNVVDPQLHFELRKGKRAVDPIPLLSGSGPALSQLSKGQL